MSVVVKFLHEWFYEFDEEHSKGVRKTFPVGMVQTLEEDIAAAALAKGAAEALTPLTEEMEGLVEMHRLYQAGYEPEEILALVQGGESGDDLAIAQAQRDDALAEVDRLTALLVEAGLDPSLTPSLSPPEGRGDGEREGAAEVPTSERAEPSPLPTPEGGGDEAAVRRRKRTKRQGEAV